ncbi:MAG: hypothetical protein ACI4GD_08885 [Lachnospiraceae bacterium]
MGKIKLRKEDLDKKYYQQIADDFEKEENKEDYNLPEEWEKGFKRIISHNLDKNDRKRRLKRLSVAAAILLVVGVGSNMWSYQVSGTNVFELFSTSFGKNKDNYSVIGADPDIEILVEEENTDKFYKGRTVNEILDSIKVDYKRPMFSFDDVFGDYNIEEAVYNSTFKTIHIKIESSEGISYIIEDDMYENSGVGIKNDNKIVSTVRNEKLNQDVIIYRTTTDGDNNRYVFSVVVGNSQFCFDGVISFYDCEKLVKSLNYE